MAPVGAVASATTRAGAMIFGGLRRFATVTENVTGAAGLCAPSAAVHVTVVVEIGNVVPEAGLQLAVPGPLTASLVAGAANVTTAPVLPAAATTMLAICAITGGVESLTAIVTLALVVLPLKSVAVQVTSWLAPTATSVPCGTSQTGTIPASRLSVADTE